jgi:hypothetical protein
MVVLDQEVKSTWLRQLVFNFMMIGNRALL